jgi:CAAX protease family protein
MVECSVPYGIVGVVMAGFLGWFLAKAMVETRGFFWPWFIHFCQDVAIFTFMAAGSIVPGGG